MYLVIILILLLILLQLNVCSDVILLLTILILSYLVCKNIIISLIIGLTLYIIIVLMNRSKKHFTKNFENFENENDDDEKETINNMRKKDLKKFDKKTKDRVNHLKNIINKLEKGISLDNDDLKESNNIKDYDFDDSKEDDSEIKKSLSKTPGQLTAHEAQRQTYQLINTVKQLESTMNSLQKPLETGKVILERLEQFKGKNKK